MNDHFYADLEERGVRELVTPYTPFSNCQNSQWLSRANTTMSSDDCGSSNTTGGDVGTTRHFRGSNDSRYYYDSDSESIKSSRLCTPPGLCMSKDAIPIPQAEPLWQTMPSFPGLTRTNLESPTPTSRPRFHSEPVFGASSEIHDDKRRREEPLVCPAETWVISPDVYEKVQSALARVLAMDQAGAGTSECDCQHSHGTAGSQPVQKCFVQAVAEDRLEEYGRHRDHKPPKSPLSPEELERAIGIIEELFVVNGVPPDVFVQSGVSPGTLYHAFKHLGHSLKRHFEGSLPKNPAPSFCGK